MTGLFTSNFKAFLCFSFVVFFSFQIQAQDTITVQTLTLDSPTRTGTFEFPDNPNQTYRKILMKYTMRCLDGALNPGDSSTGCHEWDYSCNTFITDSTTIDSTLRTHPSYIISNNGEATFDYTSQPTYTHYQYTQQEVTYDNVISENTYPIGNGVSPLGHPFSTSSTASKAQYLWTAAELSGAGISAGDITSLKMDLSSLGANTDFLRIGMKTTAQTALDAENIETAGFTDVYFLNTTLIQNENSFNFNTPFTWDGTSNILVEFSYNNPTAATNSEVNGDNAGYDAGLYSNKQDRYLDFSGPEYVDVPTDNFATISNEITVAFWSKGNDQIMPTNSTLFEGMDDNGDRQVNTHLPWGNGNVYWDCGNDGSGYDRIEKAAAVADFAGEWSHWAFTKNAVTGSMKIYLNGVEWHSGTGKNKTIDITGFRIGRSITWINEYYGSINEFQVWDKELAAGTIADWMNKDIDASHPDYANLVAYYQMDEASGQTTMDSSPNAAVGTMIGAPARKTMKGNELYRNFNQTAMRPNVSFVQGTYSQTISDVIVTESELNGQNAITSYTIEGTDLVEGTTFLAWEASEEVTYDETGNIVSTQPVAAEGTINITTLNYYDKNPSKYEIMSFVTPYGFGLDLGPEGQTWTFDVTDFAPILKGSRTLSMERGGQYNEEFDIKFLYITGTPAREVKSLQNIWPFRSASYDAITSDAAFEPRDVALAADGSQFKIRSSITGHQQEGEFTARTHFINANGGANENSFQITKECGENPVYPQGGTWIFDRQGWCPGMASDIEETDITAVVTPGSTAEIDYGVNPAADQSATNFLVSNQLVTYGAANFTLDAEVVRVMRPTADIEYQRMNPVCNNPIVIIRNTGSTTLTSLDITYGTQGGGTETYTWTGSLDFMETEEVTMPTVDFDIWQAATTNTFEVNISAPNGGTDENADNNIFRTSFVSSDEHSGLLRFNYRTNNRAYQNSFTLKDHNGNVVLERTGMANATTYNDDIQLQPGCYTMFFNDIQDDGLDFWLWNQLGYDEVANNPPGTGYFRLMQDNVIIKTFEPDFGAFIKYDFSVAGTVSNEDLENNTIISLYPNPTQGVFMLELSGFQGKEMDLQVVDVMGRTVFQDHLDVNYEDFDYNINISNFADGVYFVKINNEGNTTVKQIVKHTPK